LVWATCLASVNAATGKLRESYWQLRAVLGRHSDAQPGVKNWVLTSLAEMAGRAGMAQEAEGHFRAALALDATDNYLLAAYADFLLDNDRSPEVLALLRDQMRSDPLLLRYALPAQVEQLRDRFEASRLRGERVHLREQARFTLHLLISPAAALKLAQENWQIQKEPADVRILLEAALAARDPAVIESVREWLSGSRVEDAQLQQILAPRG
jgi:predicted Zn-dependent protease